MHNQSNLVKCLKNYQELIETFKQFLEIRIGLLIEKTLIKYVNIIIKLVLE